jgi:competence protein ComEA
MESGFFEILKKYRIEVFLIICASIISIVSVVIYANTETSQDINIEENKNDQSFKQVKNIVVDVSGAVNKPGVYELKYGSRINDAIKKAGGISDDADYNYFSRNFNLSSFVFDQEKIYVPFSWEINSGIFIEETRILNYLNPFITNSSNEYQTSYESDLININTATSQELEELSGIGQVTAKKIIDNRPYSSVEELLSKKILKQNIYENIKDQIVAK